MPTKPDSFLFRKINVKNSSSLRTIEIIFNVPQKTKENQFKCEWTLHLNNKEAMRSYMIGFDPIQAMLLSIGFVYGEIKDILAKHGGCAENFLLSDMEKLRLGDLHKDDLKSLK